MPVLSSLYARHLRALHALEAEGTTRAVRDYARAEEARLRALIVRLSPRRRPHARKLAA